MIFHPRTCPGCGVWVTEPDCPNCGTELRPPEANAVTLSELLGEHHGPGDPWPAEIRR